MTSTKVKDIKLSRSAFQDRGTRGTSRSRVKKVRVVNMLESFEDADSVSKYTTSHSVRLHPAQEKLMQCTIEQTKSAKLGEPEILQFNQNLLRIINANKVLDVGAFTGSSALAAALVIPQDGKVIACDVCEDFVNIGKPFWKEAGVEDKIDLRIQPVLKTLDELVENGEEGTFDFAFIDADKENYLNYYERCLRLLREGGIVSIDNVLWGNRVIDEAHKDPETIALRRLNDFIAKDDRVNVSMLNIGDGLTLVFKK